MQNKEFEKQVRQKMEELKLFPSSGVWNKVEASLPKEKKRRWALFFLLFASISMASLLLVKNDQRPEKSSPTLADGKNELNKVNNSIPNRNSVPDRNNTVTLTADNYPVHAVSKSDANNNKLVTGTGQEKVDAIPEKSYKEKYIQQPTILESIAMVKMSTTSSYTNEEEREKQLIESSIIAKNKPSGELNITLNTKPSDKLGKKTEQKIATGPKAKADSTASAAVKKMDTRNDRAWQYSVQFGFGIPYTKNGINNTVFTTNTTSLVSAPTTVNYVNNQPAIPSPGMVFQTGITVEKNLTGRLDMKTGLSYMFLSNNIQIGSRIDSLSHNGTTTYNNGNGISPYSNGLLPVYNNHFRFIQVPLALQFSIVKKEQFSVFLEGGVSADFLINSNALVFNGATNTYSTNKDIFNRVVYTGLGGIGVKLAKQTRVPVSLGYQFNYGLNPFIKNDETQKHLPVSLVYFRLYLPR